MKLAESAIDFSTSEISASILPKRGEAAPEATFFLIVDVLMLLFRRSAAVLQHKRCNCADCDWYD
jgi:hypothetical protein